MIRGDDGSMVNVLVIESGDEYGVVDEIVGFLSSRVQCRVTNLSVPPNVLSFPGLKIYTREQTVYRDGNLVSMSHHEFLALVYLAKHPGWIHTKEQIHEVVYMDKVAEDIENSIYCLIHSLRKKLEPDPQHPKYIQTVRGAGYCFGQK